MSSGTTGGSRGKERIGLQTQLQLCCLLAVLAVGLLRWRRRWHWRHKPHTAVSRLASPAPRRRIQAGSRITCPPWQCGRWDVL